MEENSTCKLCGENKKLIKAHVIPKAFFNTLLDSDDDFLKVISSKKGIREKISRMGIYDKHILCDTCEQKFGPLDDYGFKVLIQQFDQYFTPILSSDNVRSHQSTSVDRQRLLAFWSLYSGALLYPVNRIMVRLT